MSAARTLAALLAATLLAACDSGPAKPDRAPPPRPTARAAASASSGGAPAPSTSIAAPPVDQGARAAAGAWEGHFDAKKGSVTVPENVKDKAREGDDGKAAVGSGKVEIAIAPDGDVTGSWTGALGKDTLRGKVETDGGRTMLRASAMPEDP
ncbi:MAG TPA: hypothetical protein VHB21_11280, partial [Minicystis sp.]|nr:hypothetical protein [Minicystis sp.]